MITFIEEIFNGKFHFLCSVRQVSFNPIKKSFSWLRLILKSQEEVRKQQIWQIFISSDRY